MSGDMSKCKFCHHEIEESECLAHEKLCAIVEVPCQYKCGITMSRFLLSSHMENRCIRRIVHCQFCSVSLLQEEVQEHEEKCAMEIVECKHKCGSKIKRCDEAAHMDNCPEEVVCDFCDIKVRKEDAEEHEKNCEYSLNRCVHCGAKIQKLFMEIHLKDGCGECFSPEEQTMEESVSKDDQNGPTPEGGTTARTEELQLQEEEDTVRLMQCEYCRYYVEVHLLPNHHAVCRKFPVACPMMCEAEVSREDFEHHMEEECPERHIGCSFKKMGCDFQGATAELSIHMKTHADKHMELVIGAIENLKRNSDKSDSEQKKVDMPLHCDHDQRSPSTLFKDPKWILVCSVCFVVSTYFFSWLLDFCWSF